MSAVIEGEGGLEPNNTTANKPVLFAVYSLYLDLDGSLDRGGGGGGWWEFIKN